MQALDIRKVSLKILDLNPDPVPRYRLLRDVLHLPAGDAQLVAARQVALRSSWVKRLAEAQEANGGWGRFHSQDKKVRKPFRTTEEAVRRALALGLDRESKILKKAADYMVRILEGRDQWSDWAEKHEGWPVNIRTITAATLVTINPDHPLLAQFQNLWLEILKRTFGNGSYDPLAERQAHRDLNGIMTPGKYLHLGMLYPLLILSSIRGGLPSALEKSLLSWLWSREGGIYYVTPSRLDHFPGILSRGFSTWLDAVEVFSRFKSGRETAADAIEWIISQRNSDGLWDFGPQASSSIYFPLSESWRKLQNRVIDCTIRVLVLLDNFYRSSKREEKPVTMLK